MEAVKLVSNTINVLFPENVHLLAQKDTYFLRTRIKTYKTKSNIYRGWQSWTQTETRGRCRIVVVKMLKRASFCNKIPWATSRVNSEQQSNVSGKTTSRVNSEQLSKTRQPAA
jgi:hypothetical protein